MVDEQTVDRQQKVDHAGHDQVSASAIDGAGENQPGDAERQVHDVVQNRNAEMPSNFAPDS